MTATTAKRKLGAVAHVYPVNDERTHNLGPSGKCWCKPTHTEVHNGLKVSHNARDGREIVENELGELLAPDKPWKVKLIQ